MSNFTINRVVLVGRLTRDPELRALPSGHERLQPAHRLQLQSGATPTASTRSGRTTSTSASTAAPARASSRTCARAAASAVDGRLEWREWETAEQQKRQAVSIVADTVQFLDAPASARARAATTEPRRARTASSSASARSADEDLAF